MPHAWLVVAPWKKQFGGTGAVGMNKSESIVKIQGRDTNETDDVVRMAGRLSNKRCLIVGGTGGIGLWSARRFLQEGAGVFITGLTVEEGQRAVRDLGDVGTLGFQVCDTTDTESVFSLFQHAVAHLGGLDVLFHVAGISGRRLGDGPLHTCTEEGWAGTLDVNLTGVFRTNQAALRQFLTQGQGGVILNMASVLAFDPAPRFFDTAAYAASKAGIIGLTRLAAASYASHGIRVNALAPGVVDTPMAARAMQNEEIHAFLVAKQPLAKGPGDPLDCAEAAVFLCSDESRRITGSILAVDAGWHLSDGPI